MVCLHSLFSRKSEIMLGKYWETPTYRLFEYKGCSLIRAQFSLIVSFLIHLSPWILAFSSGSSLLQYHILLYLKKKSLENAALISLILSHFVFRLQSVEVPTFLFRFHFLVALSVIGYCACLILVGFMCNSCR